MIKIKNETRTPKIDECYEMMREKFDWDFDGLISPKDLTTQCKVGNILCTLFIPHEPIVYKGVLDITTQQMKQNPFEYTLEEYNLIEHACNEIANLCGY